MKPDGLEAPAGEAGAGAVPAQGGPAKLVTLLLLCQDLESTGTGLNLEALRLRLGQLRPSLRVETAPRLCLDYRQVSQSVVPDVGRVVLGLCSLDYAEAEIRLALRKKGLDPTSAQAVDLGTLCCHIPDRHQVVEKASLLLIGAAARAEAHPGSAMNHLRPMLAPLSSRVSRRALFTLPPLRYQPVASVDDERCTAHLGCDLCVEACPRGALRLDEQRISVERWQCDGCGICLAACPKDAIRLPGNSSTEIAAQVTAMLQAVPATQGRRQVLFVCSRSGGSPDAGGIAGPAGAPEWLPVQVPCVAMLSAGCLLQCLARGADAVGVQPCEDDCSRGQAGAVQGTVDYCRQLLQALGGPAERVQLSPPSQQEEVGETHEDAVPERGRHPGWDLGDTLFGVDAAVRAVRVLAEGYGAEADVAVHHPASPLGLITVDQEKCTGCGVCATACPTGALRFTRDEAGVALDLDARLCVACGHCVNACPEDGSRVIRVDRVTHLRRLEEGTVALCRDVEPRCEVCGAPVAPARMLGRIATLLGDEDAALAARITRRCLDCRATLW